MEKVILLDPSKQGRFVNHKYFIINIGWFSQFFLFHIGCDSINYRFQCLYVDPNVLATAKLTLQFQCLFDGEGTICALLFLALLMLECIEKQQFAPWSHLMYDISFVLSILPISGIKERI